MLIEHLHFLVAIRLTVGQTITNDDEERILLFFEALAEPLTTSSILIADEMLNPPDPLIKMAGIAGE